MCVVFFFCFFCRSFCVTMQVVLVAVAGNGAAVDIAVEKEWVLFDILAAGWPQNDETAEG